MLSAESCFGNTESYRLEVEWPLNLKSAISFKQVHLESYIFQQLHTSFALLAFSDKSLNIRIY